MKRLGSFSKVGLIPSASAASDTSLSNLPLSVLSASYSKGFCVPPTKVEALSRKGRENTPLVASKSALKLSAKLPCLPKKPTFKAPMPPPRAADFKASFASPPCNKVPMPAPSAPDATVPKPGRKAFIATGSTIGAISPITSFILSKRPIMQPLLCHHHYTVPLSQVQWQKLVSQSK